MPPLSSLIGSATLGCALIACTTVSVNVPPSGVAVPERFSAAPAVASSPASAASATAAPQGELGFWWMQADDPTLRALIDAGLRANTDIRIALDRVLEARAVITQAESALYPTIDAAGGVAKAKLNQRVPSANLPGLTLPNNVSLPMASLGTGGFAAAWEVDVFGARRSDAEAARQAALGFEERLHGAQMMVVSDIATNYIEARSIEQRIGVLERSIASAQRLQRYAEGRFEAGQATRADIDRARSLVEALDAHREPLRLLRSTRLRRLAVLTGQPPQTAPALPPASATSPLSDLPLATPLPLQLPSEVLERRPDVRGAANVVRAQAARLGSAKAELLPKFVIGFVAQDGHLDISGLPTTGGTFSSWGVGVRLPLFAGGRIRANIAAQDARLDAAAAQYEQAVLSALEDVDNAYHARQALDARATLLARSTHSAHDSAAHANRLFAEGTGLLQPVLEAQLKALQSEDELVQAQTARAVTTVLFYKAVGGGWIALPPR